jgi:anaerobic selenocysteine-containing dehydrogenase
MGHCGMVLTVDDDDQIVGVRADRDDGQTLGFACFKGLQAADLHNGPARLLHPLKRQADGSFARIPLEQALDEIAAKLREIIDADGPEVVSGYRGGGAFFNASACTLLADFLGAVGTPNLFSSVTIDQSAKMVAPGRLGMWLPGVHPFPSSDVTMVIGGNPLLSITNLDLRNPMKRLKEAKARGFKLIVIDPRLTETASSPTSSCSRCRARTAPSWPA